MIMRPVKRRVRGFTLIELMVVVALIAIASAVASLALRDPSATQLENEAARLASLLEAARAEARSSGLAVFWQPRVNGAGGPDFRFVGLPSTLQMPGQWLAPGVTASIVGSPSVVLGPEALIGPQRIVLSLEDRRLMLLTDGLGPFTVADQ
jgi:general secretion pathway protein H